MLPPKSQVCRNAARRVEQHWCQEEDCGVSVDCGLIPAIISSLGYSTISPFLPAPYRQDLFAAVKPRPPRWWSSRQPDAQGEQDAIKKWERAVGRTQAQVVGLLNQLADKYEREERPQDVPRSPVQDSLRHRDAFRAPVQDQRLTRTFPTYAPDRKAWLPNRSNVQDF